MKSFLLFLIGFLMTGFSPAQARWQSLGGIGKDVATQGNTIWTIGSDNGIWFHSGGTWHQYPGGGRGHAIDVAPDGTPFVIGTDNGIHRGIGSGWTQLTGGGRGHRIAVTDSAVPLVIGMDNAIWRYGSAPESQPVLPPVPLNLTGRWNGNDGGRYFLRQVGNELWWYGMSGDGGASWTHVLQVS